MQVNILGTEWTILECSRQNDKLLEKMDGYADKTSRKIVVSTKDDDCDLDNFEVYRKTVMRHEIIHAFLFESGLHENFQHKEYGYDETIIDWVAVQFPKLLEVFEKAGCS